MGKSDTERMGRACLNSGERERVGGISLGGTVLKHFSDKGL